MKIYKENNKGMTIIALVVTIIVMLILVGVTITMALNGGLFTYTKDAADGTKREIMLEGEMANIPEGKDANYLIEKYTKE